MSDLPGLKDVLDAQCAVQQKLLSLEEEKTGALLSGDVQVLVPLLNSQQALLAKCRELEKQRSALCSDTGYSTLKELVNSGGEYESLLGGVYLELSSVVTKLKKKCAQNKKLLDTRLATIKFLTGRMEQEPGAATYKKNAPAKG